MGSSSGAAGRRGALLAASGPIAFLVLEFAQGQLGLLHLRSAVGALIGLMVSMTALLIGALNGARAIRQAEAAVDDRLIAALLQWPPRTVAESDCFTVGVRLTPPTEDGAYPYVRREVDDQIDACLAAADIVVLIGPPQSGKSRAAYEAALAHHGEAQLLAPRDSAGLAELLASGESAGLQDRDAVMWLDDLDRFLDDLDLGRLESWLRRPREREPQSPVLLWLRARWRPVGAALVRGAWSVTQGLRRKLGREVYPPPGYVPTRKVLATVSSDRFEELMRGSDDVARAFRRLVARSSGVYVSETLTPAQAAHLGVFYGRSALGSIADAFAEAAPGGWGRPPPPPHPPRRARGRFGWSIGLPGAVLAILAGVLFAVVHHFGSWTEPPPIVAQLRALQAALPLCEVGVPSGSDGVVDHGAPLVLAVDAHQCPGSDEVRFYAASHGLLHSLVAESPMGPGDWGFRCIGPGPDRCRLSGGGGLYVTVGAFVDPAQNRLLPILFYARPGGRPRASAPYLPPAVGPAGGGQPGPDSVTFRLRQGAAFDANAARPRNCPSPPSLCSYPADALTVVGTAGPTPNLLVAGYVIQGLPGARRTLRTVAWPVRIDYGQVTARVDQQACLLYRQGAQVPTDVSVLPRESNEAAAARVWSPGSGDEAVIC